MKILKINYKTTKPHCRHSFVLLPKDKQAISIISQPHATEFNQRRGEQKI
jgi:hypothetical protein